MVKCSSTPGEVRQEPGFAKARARLHVHRCSSKWPTPNHRPIDPPPRSSSLTWQRVVPSEMDELKQAMLSWNAVCADTSTSTPLRPDMKS